MKNIAEFPVNIIDVI